MRICDGPTSGISRSTSSKGPPAFETRTALIVFGTVASITRRWARLLCRCPRRHRGATEMRTVGCLPLDELEREAILGVRFVDAGVGVPVAPVRAIAQEIILGDELEPGALHLVAHQLLVDAMQRLC